MKRPASAGKWPIDRKHPRFVVDLRLLVKAATMLHGRTKNISESGIAATVAGDINLGEAVELQFQLPGTTAPLTVHADVRYRQGFQYGFSFLNVGKEQVDTIRRALSQFPIETSDAP